MALRFFDGFDHYPSSEILDKWTTISNFATFVTGRFGGSGYQTNRSLTKALTAKNTWIIGFAMRNMNFTGNLLHFLNGGTTQVTLHLDATTGRLSVRRAGTTVVAQGVKQLAQSTWYYIELYLVFSDTVGVAHIKIDGSTDINATNIDTNNAGGSVADRFQFGDAGVTNIIVEIDDLYVCDGDGSAPYNDFLGDCVIETIYPNGNGTTSQLVGQDANSVDNYQNVDETNSDDDTTYNESSTVGEKDTYNYGALATATGTVYAVQLLPWARKTSAGTRDIVTVARLSGTEEDSAAIALPSTYTYVAQDIRTTKPGGGAWTISDVNSAEFGVKVDA